MNRAASGLNLVGLSAWMVLAAGCAGRSLPSHSAFDDRADGVTEEQAADATEPPPQTRPADGTEETGARRDPHRVRRTVGWISLAIGAEAAIVAVTTSFMLLHEKSVLNDSCDAQKHCNPVGIDAKESINGTVPWNTASWIVAVAGVGAGTILLLTSRPDSGKSTALTISPTPAGFALGLRSFY